MEKVEYLYTGLLQQVGHYDEDYDVYKYTNTEFIDLSSHVTINVAVYALCVRIIDSE